MAENTLDLAIIKKSSKQPKITKASMTKMNITKINGEGFESLTSLRKLDLT